MHGKIKNHIIDVLIGFATTFATVAIFGHLISLSKYGLTYGETIANYVSGKMGANPLSVLGLATITGLSIGFLKEALKSTEKLTHHYLINLVVVFVYVAIGCPQILSELMYLSLAGELFASWRGILHLSLVLAGNYIGFLLTLLIFSRIKKAKELEESLEDNNL
ncbi:MAG: hypothetical protein GX343_03870 [Erysipelotrichaceae bacterium]|nr:hypothetical protein [Bacilli bacterium]NLJ32954.1 hypothetical protein [Erysipelotrichaceae bacterium]